MMDQKIILKSSDDVSLSVLRRLHSQNKFNGNCVVLFAPSLFDKIIELPSFRWVDDYKFTKPVSDDEIGGVEVFHFVPSSEINYNHIGII